MRNPVGGAERKVKPDGAGGRVRPGRPSQDAQVMDGGDGQSGEVAEYLLDMLTSARQLAAAQGYRFLAYLLGLALEEARQLAHKGESWSTSWRDRPSGSDAPRE